MQFDLKPSDLSHVTSNMLLQVMIFEMYSPKEQQTIEFLDHSILDNKYIHSVLDQY